MKRLHPERLHKTVLIVCVLCLVGALTTTYFDAKASTEALVAAGWEDYLDISDASSLTFTFSCLFNNACRPIAWEQFTAQRFFQLTRGLIIGFFVFMLLAAIINLFFSAGPEEKDPGGGNFAADEDLKAYLSDGKDPGNPRKGHYGYTESGKQLRAPLRDRCTHLAIFAGTGGGKTTRIIKPSLIQDALDGTSVLMVDPKWPDPRGGYSDILAVFKKQGYEVQVFCPFEEHTLKLPLIGSLQSHDDAEVLASIIVPKTTSGEVSDGSQFYRNQERELLKHLLWGEAQAGRGSIGDVYDLIDGGPKALLRWLEHCEDQKIHKSMTTLMQNRQETLIGIIQGLKGSLSIFTNERLDAATQAGSHGWQNLDASSLTKKKSVLYVGIPQQMFLRGEGKLLLNLFFRRIMDEVLGIATQQGGRLERHLAVYIDEFAHIGKLDHAGSWFGTMRSYNIAFTVALQNRAQLEMVYGSVGARAMEGGNFQHLITFPAALKGDDKEYVSKLLGEVTAEDISRSRSHEGIFGQYRWTETRRRVARPLLSREEMNKWDPDYGVLMPHGAGPTKIAAPMIHQRRVGMAKNGFYKFRDMIGKGDSLTLVKTLLSQYKVAWRILDPPEEKQPKPVPSGEAITPRVDVFEAQRVAEAAPTSAAEEDLTVPLTPQDVQVSPIQIAKESAPTKGEKAPAKKSAGQAPRKKSQPSPGQGEALHHVPSGQLMPSFRTWVEGLSWRDVPLTVFRVREGGQDRISKILFEQLPGALRHEHLAHWKQRRWIQVRGDKLGIINNGCVVLCQKQLDSFLALPQAQIVEVGGGNERVVVKARAVASKQLNTAKKRDNDTSTSGKHLAASTLSSSKDDLKVQALLRTWLRGNGYRLDGHPDYDCWRDQLPHKALLGRYIPEVLYVQESYLKNLTGLPSQAITRFPRSTQRVGDEEVFTRAIPGEVVRHALPLRKLLADDAILLEDHPSRTGAEKAVGIYQAATIQSQKATLQAVTRVSLEHLSEQILKVGQRKGEKRRSMRLLTLPLQPEPLPAPNAQSVTRIGVMKNTLLTLIGILSLSLSLAQEAVGGAPTVDAATKEMLAEVGYQVVSSPQDIATLYNVATSEILIAADAIVSEEVADTLRRAVVERGVSLFILTREDTVDAPESYVKSLTAAGANVRTSEAAANFALIDREWAVVGPMAAGWPKVAVQEPLPLIDPELEAGTDLLTWFFETAEERSAMQEAALLAAQGEVATDTTGMCEEQLAISSIAQLLMGTTLPSTPPTTIMEDGTTPTPEAPTLADPSCYAYAEPTGLTTLIMEPNYVYQLLDGYYQAFVAAEPFGG